MGEQEADTERLAEETRSIEHIDGLELSLEAANAKLDDDGKKWAALLSKEAAKIVKLRAMLETSEGERTEAVTENERLEKGWNAANDRFVKLDEALFPVKAVEDSNAIEAVTLALKAEAAARSAIDEVKFAHAITSDKLAKAMASLRHFRDDIDRIIDTAKAEEAADWRAGEEELRREVAHLTKIYDAAIARESLAARDIKRLENELLNAIAGEMDGDAEIHRLREKIDASEIMTAPIVPSSLGQWSRIRHAEGLAAGQIAAAAVQGPSRDDEDTARNEHFDDATVDKEAPAIVPDCGDSENKALRF